MPVEALARSARLLFGGARFPRVPRVSPGPREGRYRQRRAAERLGGHRWPICVKLVLRRVLPLKAPCALGEASVRRRALPTRHCRQKRAAAAPQGPQLAQKVKFRPRAKDACGGPMRARRGFCSAARASHAYPLFPQGRGKNASAKGEQLSALGATDGRFA
eukprot:scaffold19100_cov36-Phaeocystis_antarctica.AAC.3